MEQRKKARLKRSIRRRTRVMGLAALVEVLRNWLLRSTLLPARLALPFSLFFGGIFGYATYKGDSSVGQVLLSFALPAVLCLVFCRVACGLLTALLSLLPSLFSMEQTLERHKIGWQEQMRQYGDCCMNSPEPQDVEVLLPAIQWTNRWLNFLGHNDLLRTWWLRLATLAGTAWGLCLLWEDVQQEEQFLLAVLLVLGIALVLGLICLWVASALYEYLTAAVADLAPAEAELEQLQQWESLLEYPAEDEMMIRSEEHE